MTTGLRRLPIRAALLALAATCAPSAGADAYTEERFTARVGDVRLNARLIEQGKAPGDRVSVELPARLFEPPLEIADVREADPGHGPLVDFLVRYWRANVEGDADAVVAAWCDGSRESIRRFVGNEQLFERNQRALRERPGLTIRGLVRHADTTSILVARGPAVTGVTLRTGDGSPCLVEEPADDLALAIVEASLEP